MVDLAGVVSKVALNAASNLTSSPVRAGPARSSWSQCCPSWPSTHGSGSAATRPGEWNTWYETAIPTADDLLDAYLIELRSEGLT